MTISRSKLGAQSGMPRSAPDQKTEIMHLVRDIKGRRRSGSIDSSDFFKSALKRLSQLKGSANAELRLSGLFEIGIHFFNGGRIAAAKEVIPIISSLASQARNKLWLRKANTFSGMVYADEGNLAQAFVSYERALAIAREIGDTESEQIVLMNTGVALMYAGLDHEAISCFEHALKNAGPLDPYTCHALSNLAQCHLHLEQFDEALGAISLCLSKTPEATDLDSALSRTIREFTFVQIALGMGNLKLARERRDLCISYGKWGFNERAQMLTEISIGLCEIYGGEVERGLQILESALQRPQSVASKIDTLMAVVKAYDCIDRPDLALHAFRDLAQLLQKSRTDSLAAISHLQSKTMGLARVGKGHPMEKMGLKLRARAAEREVVNARVEMLERLAVTADLKEEASGQHGYRVGRLSALVAQDLGWNRDECRALDLAARLHDIGKIGVPDRILLTSEQLKEAERHFMSTHTSIGAELLGKSDIPHIQLAEEIARFHHEWWDGNGYPSKRKGKRIPIHARIVAIADVFDALTHGRPFSAPWPMDRALDEIRSRIGTQFDPEIAEVFLARVERLRREQPDLDGYLGKAGKNSPFLQARERIRLMLAEERDYEKKASVGAAEVVH